MDQVERTLLGRRYDCQRVSRGGRRPLTDSPQFARFNRLCSPRHLTPQRYAPSLRSWRQYKEHPCPTCRARRLLSGPLLPLRATPTIAASDCWHTLHGPAAWVPGHHPMTRRQMNLISRPGLALLQQGAPGWNRPARGLTCPQTGSDCAAGLLPATLICLGPQPLTAAHDVGALSPVRQPELARCSACLPAALGGVLPEASDPAPGLPRPSGFFSRKGTCWTPAD